MGLLFLLSKLRVTKMHWSNRTKMKVQHFEKHVLQTNIYHFQTKVGFELTKYLNGLGKNEMRLTLEFVIVQIFMTI